MILFPHNGLIQLIYPETKSVLIRARGMEEAGRIARTIRDEYFLNLTFSFDAIRPAFREFLSPPIKWGADYYHEYPLYFYSPDTGPPS
jgi:hypothetical protein